MAAESSLKVTKNDFYLTLKILFVLKTSVLFLDFFVIQRNSVVRKIKLISKFMTSQPGKQTIAIHILCNISGREDNQRPRPGQLIEYNIRSTFLEILYTKCGGETFMQSKLLQSLFLLYAKLRIIEVY